MLVCEQMPDGVIGYTRRFVASVVNGQLHGGYGTTGQPDSMVLDGAIASDGTALLLATGLTGQPRGAAGRVIEGSRFSYHVAAKFVGNHGEGKRLETRACSITATRS